MHISTYIYIQRGPKVGIRYIVNYCIPTFSHPVYIYIFKTLNYITNAPTCFGTSAPSSGSFNIASLKVIKYVYIYIYIYMCVCVCVCVCV